MPTASPTQHHVTTTELGSIRASMAYLRERGWFKQFRERRQASTQLIDDVLWTGHFCAWLRERDTEIEACTERDLRAYLATTATFRPGPRAACERTVSALVEFIANREGRSAAGDQYR